RKHIQVIAVQIAAVALSAALSISAAVVFGSVETVAVAVMVANVASGVATLWLGLSATADPRTSPLRELIREIAPVILLGCLTFALVRAQQVFVGFWLAATASALLLMGMALTAFGLASARILWPPNKSMR